MWLLKKHNQGSITIEMCFVIPIVLGIVIMLIMLIIKGANEGAALGGSQIAVYQYSDWWLVEEDGNQLEQLKDVGILEQINGYMDIGEDYVSVTAKSQREGNYTIATLSCTREINLCTNRLRRWQLYGDVLWE